MNKKGLGLSIGLASIAITGSIVSPQLVQGEGNISELAENKNVEVLREERILAHQESKEVSIAENALEPVLHTEEAKVAESLEVKEYAQVSRPAVAEEVETPSVETEEIKVAEAAVETEVEETEEEETEVENVELAGEEVQEEVVTAEAEVQEELEEEIQTAEVETVETGQVQLSSEEEEGIDIPEVESEEKEISIPFNGWLSANMNVRQNPSTESTVLGVLPLGTKIEGRIKNGWLEFEYNNQKAYLMADYLSTEEIVVQEVEEVEEVFTESDNTTEEETKVEGTKQGYVTSPVNVRDAATMKSNILGVLPRGTEITGVRQGSWIQIDYNGKTAYVSMNLVGEKAPAKEEAPVQDAGQANGTKQGYVTSPVNVRDASTMKSNILGVLPRGTEITGVRQGSWIQIDYNGKTAYVSVNLVGEKAPAKEEAPVQDAGQANGTTAAIVQEAHNLLGYRYVYGNHSPSTGFDCSGLVYYLYQKHAGTTLNRSSYQMVNNGYQVSTSALKPGDVLLFNAGGNSRISHVGLYIGNGEMIHSSTPQTGVIKSSIKSGYFANTLVTARRIID